MALRLLNDCDHKIYWSDLDHTKHEPSLLDRFWTRRIRRAETPGIRIDTKITMRLQRHQHQITALHVFPLK